MFGEHDRGAALVADLRRRADAVDAATKQLKAVKVFYQVADEPLYTIGRDAYLTDLVRRAGGVSVTADVAGAFPRYSDESALAARPEAIILPTGGAMGSAKSTTTIFRVLAPVWLMVWRKWRMHCTPRPSSNNEFPTTT
jgi:ABC-type Fe3+-hydroxamate transport system substrate-binding protein